MTDSHAEIDEFLEFVSRAGRLEDLPRTGWIASGVQHPESIAAHTYEVALVTLWLADRVDCEVDTARALRIALLHDLSEALLTDLPKPVKESLGDDVVRSAEERAADRLFADLGDDWREAVEAYHRQETPEARVVKAADRIQMMAKSLTYDSQGRGDVRRFWESRETFDDFGFPLVGAIFERLRERWESDDWFPNDFE